MGFILWNKLSVKPESGWVLSWCSCHVAPVGFSSQVSHCWRSEGSLLSMTAGYFYPWVPCIPSSTVKLAKQGCRFYVCTNFVQLCAMTQVCGVSCDRVLQTCSIRKPIALAKSITLKGLQDLTGQQLKRNNTFSSLGFSFISL